MTKIYNARHGSLYTLDSNGKREVVPSFEAPLDDCECKFNCCEGEVPSISFKHPEEGFVKIPLPQLYNFMKAGDLTDIINPEPVTTLAAGAITATTIPVTWVDGTDTNADGVNLYLNDAFVIKVAMGAQAYTFTGLTASTTYVLSARVVDTAGNLSTVVAITESTIA